MDSPTFFASDAADDALVDDMHFRLSVNSDSALECPLSVASGATTSALPLFTLPPFASDASDSALLWNLISPCSEPQDSPSSCAMEEISLDQGPHNEAEEDDERPEPEPEKPAETQERQKTDNSHTAAIIIITHAEGTTNDEQDDGGRYASCCSDSDDEEVEVFNAGMPFARRRSSLDGKALDGSEKLDSVTEVDEMDDVDVSSTTSSQLFYDDSTSEDGSSFGGRPSLASISGKWVGRMKARTYSGSASVKMQQTYEKLRARTLSATSVASSTASSRWHGTSTSTSATHTPKDWLDDGGFSSDDEDFDREQQRASHLPASARLSSFSFPTARLNSVRNGVKVPSSVSSLAMRFRSSSSGTTVSEDGSIVGTASLPNGSSDFGSSTETHREAGGEGGAAGGHYQSYHTSTQELKLKASACASRAAGILGAASAEAARKLKASRAFRSSASQASPVSMAAPSPIIVVDCVVECSPSDILHPSPAAHLVHSSSGGSAQEGGCSRTSSAVAAASGWR